MATFKTASSRGLRLCSNPGQFGAANVISRALTSTSNNAHTPASLTLNKPSVKLESSYLPPSALRGSLRNPRTTREGLSLEPAKVSQHQNAFDHLINSIASSLTSTSRPSLPELHNVLRLYTSESNHWSKYAHGNSSKQYTRNLVYTVPGVFNLLLLVWTPGQKSLIHDHADAHCLMKVLKGSIQETRFAMPENPGEQGPLMKTSLQTFELNKVSYMADKLGLHSISNPHPTEYAVSLHLYAPPNAALRGCHVFDEQNGAARHVSQNSYDSVGGHLVT